MKNSVGNKLTSNSLKCNAGLNAYRIPKIEKVNREKALPDFIL